MYIHTHTYIYICTHTYIHTHTHTHTRTHTYIHTYIHTYTYIHVRIYAFYHYMTVCNTIRKGFLMSQNPTKFVRCCYFKLTTCFSPCSGLSSGHKSIYSRKLYSIRHKIYQSKIQREF